MNGGARVHIYSSLVYSNKPVKTQFMKTVASFLKNRFNLVAFGGQIETNPNLVDFYFKVTKKLTKKDLASIAMFLKTTMKVNVKELENVGSEAGILKKPMSTYNKFVSEFAKKQREAGKKFSIKAAAAAWQKHKRN